jgi:hypothetical protein
MGLVTRDHEFANFGVAQHPYCGTGYVLADW